MVSVAAETSVTIGISNRHIHLTREHVEILFGQGHELTPLKELKQPGQYAAEETVTIVGPKGAIKGVRVLGPVRSESQVEISQTDAYKLGVKPPLRDSGHVEDTPGIEVLGSTGRVSLARGVILAARHIHMHTSDAAALGLKDKDRVRVAVPGERGLVFENVLIRVSPEYSLEMHVDTDEANACLLKNGQQVEVKVNTN